MSLWIFYIVLVWDLSVEAQALDNYKKISSTYNLVNNDYNAKQMLASLEFRSIIQCSAYCSTLVDCVLYTVNQTTCCFYGSKSILVKESSNSELWYKSNQSRTITIFNNTDSSLTSYWPIINGAATDFISGKDLTSPSPTYVADRFNTDLGSIRTSNDTNYWQAPEGVYFWSDFTIAGWYKVMGCNDYTRFMDFGRGAGLDNVNIVYSQVTTPCAPLPYITIYSGGTPSSGNTLTSTLNLNTWYHVAFSLCGFQLRSYLNGNNQLNTTTTFSVQSVTRNSNYFGKANWPGGLPAYVDFDEIKIYNRCLTLNEINNDYNNLNLMFYDITL